MIRVDDDIRITEITGSLERGGWEAQFTALNDTDLFERWQEMIVTWHPALGSGFGAPRTGFKGFVLPQRFEYDLAGSQMNGVAQTSDGFLRRAWLQGIGFAEVAARANYHQFDTVGAATATMDDWMTLGKIVTHILGYLDTFVDLGPTWIAHTNMVFHPVQNPHGWISLDNVELENSAHVTRYIVRETDNLWTRLRDIAENEFYVIVFDKQDTLWYKPHPMYLAVLPPPVMTFDEDFVAAKPVVEFRDIEQLRQVKLHAVDDNADLLHSEFPAAPTHTYGNVLEISRIRVNEQATLDLWAERKFKFETRPWTVQWTAPGLCGLLFEILDRVQITYTGTTQNGVHIDWLNKKFWIHDIRVEFDGPFTGRTIFRLEAENV